MPTYQLTDPNTGRKLRVTGDSPPTQDEILQLFNEFKVEEIAPPTQDELKEKALSEMAAQQSPLEAGLIAAGRGLTTIGRGLGLVEPESDIEKEAFKALEKESPIATTIGEISGEAAPFLLPGGAIGRIGSLGKRALATGFLGASEAGLITSGKGRSEDEILQSIGVGGAVASGLELALPVIGRIGGKVIRNATGKAPSSPVLDRAGNPTPEFMDALEKTGLSFDDIVVESGRLLETGNVEDAAQLSRKAFLESQGIVPTRAQVTGDAAEFQAQQELAKTSGRVRRALEGQESILANRFEHAVTATGGSANRSNSPVIDFVADRSIDLDQQISNAYRLAREAAPTDKIVKPSRLTDSIRDIAGSDKATGGLASAARDILRSKGVLEQGKGLKTIGKVDAKTAEEIRADLNGLFDSLTPFGRKKLAELKNSLDFDVEKAIGSDIFAPARQAKAKFEKDLSRAKINKFDKRKKNLVRDILENKINPDRFLNDAVLSKSVRSTDLEQLKRYLQLDGSEAGMAAWNDLRADAMEHIRNTAVKEVAGEPALSRAGMEKALDSLGRDKLRVLFSGDERKFLNDMLKTSKLREPVRGTALGKGPSAQAIGELTRAVNKLPLVNFIFGDAVEFIGTTAKGRRAVSQPALRATPSTAASQLAPALGVAVTTQTQEQ